MYVVRGSLGVFALLANFQGQIICFRYWEGTSNGFLVVELTWFCSVMASTRDSDSRNLGSTPSKTFLFFNFFFQRPFLLREACLSAEV